MPRADRFGLRPLALLTLVTLCAGCGARRAAVRGGNATDPADAVAERALSLAAKALACPSGTEAVGTPPPAGTEVWCSKVTANGRRVKHGPYEKWHPNGVRAARGAHDEDRVIGHWWYWSSTGELTQEGDHSPSGWWQVYLPGSEGTVVAEEGPMIQGQKDGTWVARRFDDSGAVTAIEQQVWRKGLKDGTWLLSGPDGVPHTAIDYQDNRQTARRSL